jgi:hypothetical protein
MGRLILVTLLVGLAAALASVAIPVHMTTEPRSLVPHSPEFGEYDSIRTNLADYIWPTDAGHVMTSTFGEYRRLHFHGGIDISTGNRTGYRVFAARKGHVARMRISPNGYGKMLYVRHADGYYSTYAHLEKFAVALEERALEEQLRAGAYPIDISLHPDEFPVSQGEVIAFTGETGVGSPHLHFEIRDENLNPVNPLLCEEINARDNIPPRIMKLAFRPIGEQSHLQGQWKPRVITPRLVREGRYTLSETLRATGMIGISINARDRSNNSRFLHGVYSYDLYLDTALIYSVRLDRVPGRLAHHIGLYYDWRLRDQGRGKFEKLYAEAPGVLPFATPATKDAGIITAERYGEGTHVFRIVAADINGNTSEVTGTIVLNHPPSFRVEQKDSSLVLEFETSERNRVIHLQTRKLHEDQWKRSKIVIDDSTDLVRIPVDPRKSDIVRIHVENSGGSTSRPHFSFLRKPSGPPGSLRLERHLENGFVRIGVRANGVLTAPPVAIVYEGSSRREIMAGALDLDEYELTFRPLETFAGTRRVIVQAEINGQEARALDEFDLYPILSNTSGSLSIREDRLRITYDSSSVFSTLFLLIEYNDDGEDETYRLIPENTVLKGTLTVRALPTRTVEKQGLFFRGPNGWDLVSSSVRLDDGGFTGTISRTLGELTLTADRTPPYISHLQIATPRKLPRISFRYGDNFSGVEYNELKMYIDDVLVIPEIDGEHRRVTYQGSRLEQGSHHLRIRIQDLMGNTNEVERRFTVR